MRLVIDISEKDYLECVKRVEEIREKGYMIENLKYKTIIADGTPLEDIKVEIQNTILEQTYEKGQNDVLDKIRTEIEDTGAYEQEVHGKTEFLKGITYCLNIIDKYKAESELKGDNNG